MFYLVFFGGEGGGIRISRLCGERNLPQPHRPMFIRCRYRLVVLLCCLVTDLEKLGSLGRFGHSDCLDHLDHLDHLTLLDRLDRLDYLGCLDC